MKTQVSKLIRDVMTALREVDPNEAEFIGDKDNADLETMIASKIEATVDAVHRNAAMRDLALDSTIDILYNGDSSSQGFAYRRKNGVLTVLLEACEEEDKTTGEAEDDTLTLGIDMLRMVCARSKSWPFDVHHVVYPDDPLFEIVTDKYVGAQSDFPAVTHRKKRVSAGGRRVLANTLELRCLSAETDWAHVTLMPRAKIVDGQVDIDRNMYDKVVNAIAQEMGAQA